LKGLLLSRTEGNPFFLEESVRSLVDNEVLAGERGAYRVAAAIEHVRVPATVQELLAARIDRLPPEDKDLLQTASVVGTDVPVAVLAAVAGGPADALPDGLARLQAAEFLYETSLFPDAAYTFKHALTHEVAYGSALDLAHRQKERGNEAWVLRLLGEIALHADPPDLESAEAHYGRALARVDELGMRPLAAHCHLGLGKL
jgi:predicted ATPase